MAHSKSEGKGTTLAPTISLLLKSIGKFLLLVFVCGAKIIIMILQKLVDFIESKL